jgi:hypothetical protein
MNFFILIFLYIIISKIKNTNQQNDTEPLNNIYFVVSHFRHGARTPNKFKNASEDRDYINVTWDEGVGELTKLGVIQHFIIGVKNRKRYDNFLSKEFNPNEILSYSTNLNRTKSSGYAQLLGLYFEQYNLNSSDAKNITPIDIDVDTNISNLISYPVPYFIFEEIKRGNVIKYEKTFDYDRDMNCPKVIPIRNKNKKLDKHYIEFFNSFDNMQEFLEKYFNYNFTESDKFEQLHRFCDAFISQVTHNKTHELLIKYRNITKTYLKCIEYEKLKLFNIEQGGQANFTGEMSMGSVMLKILNFMEMRMALNNRTEIIKNKPKFVMYSSHDTTLASMGRFILSAFNITIPYPYYASSQVFELRKYNNDFNVEMYFDDKLAMNISYNDFKNKIVNLVWTDRSIIDYCESYNYYEFLIIGIGFCIIIISIVIVTLILLLVKYNPKGEFRNLKSDSSGSIIPNEEI